MLRFTGRLEVRSNGSPFQLTSASVSPEVNLLVIVMNFTLHIMDGNSWRHSWTNFRKDAAVTE